MIMKTMAKYSVFLFVGAAVGAGSYGLTDYQWWVWVLILNSAIGARDWAISNVA